MIHLMNRSWLITGLFLLPCSGTLLFADEPVAIQVEPARPVIPQPNPNPNAQLDQIIKDLSSDDWKLRQQAADALSEIDESQVPRLRQLAETTKDVDLRNTLLAAIGRLEERTMISPSMVTLHVKDASGVSTLEELGKQLDFGLVADSVDWLNGTKVTADIDRQPFWAAMKTLAPQWPVRINPAPNEGGRLRLLNVGNDYLSANSTVAGPFLVCPVSLQTSGSVDLLAAPPAFKFRTFMLQIAVLPEPKLRASRVRVSATNCLDEKGNKIKTTDDNAGANVGVGMIGMTSSHTSLTMIRLYPEGDIGKRIATMSGMIRFRMPTRFRNVEMNDLQAGKENPIELGGRQFKVTVTQQEKDYLVKLTMPTNVSTQDEAVLAATREMALLDAAGNPLFRRGTTQSMVNRNWEFNTVFAREGISFGPGVKSTGEAAKLVWSIPIESKNVEQPFELKDLRIAP